MMRPTLPPVKNGSGRGRFARPLPSIGFDPVGLNEPLPV